MAWFFYPADQYCIFLPPDLSLLINWFFSYFFSGSVRVHGRATKAWSEASPSLPPATNCSPVRTTKLSKPGAPRRSPTLPWTPWCVSTWWLGLATGGTTNSLQPVARIHSCGKPADLYLSGICQFWNQIFYLSKFVILKPLRKVLPGHWIVFISSECNHKKMFSPNRMLPFYPLSKTTAKTMVNLLWNR